MVIFYECTYYKYDLYMSFLQILYDDFNQIHGLKMYFSQEILQRYLDNKDFQKILNNKFHDRTTVAWLKHRPLCWDALLKAFFSLERERDEKNEP